MNCEYKLIRSSRKTLALQIKPDGSLEARAPLKMPEDKIRDFVISKRNWIEKHRQRRQDNPIVHKAYTEGEEFLFLGKAYPLCFSVEQKTPVVLSDSFCVSEQYRDRAEQIIKAWYRYRAGEILRKRVEHFSVLTGLKPGQIRINSAQKRWGSCSRRGFVNFSFLLVLAPVEIVDYVIVHELVHLVRHDHSKTFWNKVETILPDYRERRMWLRLNARRLRL